MKKNETIGEILYYTIVARKKLPPVIAYNSDYNVIASDAAQLNIM